MTTVHLGMVVPDSIGVMILNNAVLFPQALLPLRIFEPRYRTMLAEALDSHRMFCVAMQKPSDPRETPLPVAGIGIVRAAVKNADGTSNLILQGVARVRLGKVVRYKPYRFQQIHMVDIGDSDSVTVDALKVRVLELVEEQLHAGGEVANDLLKQLVRTGGDSENPIRSAIQALRMIPNPGQFADLIALLAIQTSSARQVILQSATVAERLRHLIQFLQQDLTTEAGEDNGLF